jgi:hypothetical protein
VDLISKHHRNVALETEALAPAFVLMGLVAKRKGEGRLSRRIWERSLSHLLRQNSLHNRSEAVPDPYYSVDQVLEATWKVAGATIDRAIFRGTSYSSRCFVECLARAGWKTALKALWGDVTRLHHAEFLPQRAWEHFAWHTDKGELDLWTPDTPQRWQALLESANQPDISPKNLARERAFVPAFLMAFPHRLRRGLVQLIDE